MKEVKIFGERNTGTNALKRIIENNSKSICLPGTVQDVDSSHRLKFKKWKLLQLSTGKSELWYKRRQAAEIDKIFSKQPLTNKWKHSATYTHDVIQLQNVTVLFCIRHPVSWIYGLWKKPYHALQPTPNEFKEFIKVDWELMERDNLNTRTLKPVELYIEKLNSYIDIIEKLQAKKINFKIIKMEELILQQESVFENIKNVLLSPNLEFSKLSNSTKSKNLDLEYYKYFYGNEIWRTEISKHIADITDQIPTELYKYFDYEP